MDQLSDEEVDIRDDEEEEDSDKEDQDLDKMFGAWLGELDKLTQVLRCHEKWFVVRISVDLVLWLFNNMPIKQIVLHTFIFALLPPSQSLDDGRPGQPQAQQKAPLRQETNMANFSYRFSVYNINGQTTV